jgi:GNAT superfamily N-acetyltransferase
MLIYVTDVAGWASPSHEQSEAEREKLCVRRKLEASRAFTLEMETPPTDIEEFNIADMVVKIRPPPVRSDIIRYENEHENDSDQPSWLEQLYGIAKFRKQAIGRLDAKLIHRDHFVGSFAEDIREPSKGTAQMALDLFDRYGRLRPEFLEHPFKKGSSVWRDELSSGDLLLLDEINVNEAYRRQGIATKLVETVIQACRARSDVFFALVRPGALLAEANMQIARLHEQTNMYTVPVREMTAVREAFDDLVQDINTDHEVKATRFWRSVGFRRVGSSSWFALAGDASHPAHNLPAEKDFELPDVA